MDFLWGRGVLVLVFGQFLVFAVVIGGRDKNWGWTLGLLYRGGGRLSDIRYTEGGGILLRYVGRLEFVVNWGVGRTSIVSRSSIFINIFPCSSSPALWLPGCSSS